MTGQLNISPRMGLGTVEFGMNYGITNTQGRPSESDIATILTRAAAAEFRYLDTAASYGDSEVILGRCLPKSHTFRIITKTPFFNCSEVTDDDADELTRRFQISLNNLRQTRVYGLLIHQAEDLLAPNGELLWKAMQALKQEGKVQKIGVSIYTAEQIESLLSRYTLDLIQVPLHVLDQRLIKKGLLQKLKKQQIEVHARSIFFQGVLLMSLDNLPDFLANAKPCLTQYAEFRNREKLTSVQAALLFAASQSEVDTILVGVNSLQEFDEIAAAAQHLPQKTVKWSDVACLDESLLDPSRWPAKERKNR